MDIDMSATRQQMLETAEHLNQQMTDGIPFTWETLEQALTSVTEQDDKGIHGWICYFAAFYQLTTGNQEGCLHYLDESVRCLLGTDQEHHVARVYNMIGIVAHMQNNLSLAMEQYDKALDYTEKYDDKMVHSIVLSNMSDAYYLIGAYERAVQCHAECIREFEQADDNSTYSRINFRKMLASTDAACCICIWMTRRKRYCVNWKRPGRARRSYVRQGWVSMYFWLIWRSETETGRRQKSMYVQR